MRMKVMVLNRAISFEISDRAWQGCVILPELEGSRFQVRDLRSLSED